jgi:hypothetical protein
MNSTPSLTVHHGEKLPLSRSGTVHSTLPSCCPTERLLAIMFLGTQCPKGKDPSFSANPEFTGTNNILF